MSTLTDAIAAEIAARQSAIDKLRAELEELGAMKTTAEGLDAFAPALDAASGDGDPSRRRTARTPRRAPAPPGGSPAAGPAPTRPAPARPPAGAGGGAPKGGLTTKQRALVDALGRLGEASTSQVAAAAGRSGEEVAVGAALKDLRDGGYVSHNGLRAKAARWIALDRSQADAAVAAKPLRMTNGGDAASVMRDVMATLQQDPGLTEDQLAQALGLDREDVAVACGTLLEREWVVLAPNGEYSPAPEATNGEQGGGTTR